MAKMNLCRKNKNKSKIKYKTLPKTNQWALLLFWFAILEPESFVWVDVLFENAWIFRIVADFLYARCILLSTFDFVEAYKSSLSSQPEWHSHRAHIPYTLSQNQRYAMNVRSSGFIEILRSILFSETLEMQHTKNRYAVLCCCELTNKWGGTLFGLGKILTIIYDRFLPLSFLNV